MIKKRTNSLLTKAGTVLASADGHLRTNTPAVAADLLVHSHGDSMTRDFVSTSENYINTVETQIIADEALQPRIWPRGINGISWDVRWLGEPYVNTMIQDAPLVTDVIQDASIPNWVVLFAGTNGLEQSIGGNSVPEELADFETYIQGRNAAGWSYAEMVVCTMLARVPGIIETVRTDYNNGLISRAATFGYRLARFDLDPNIGGAAANLDPTYFYDQIHLNELGHTIAGTIVKDAIFP